MTYAGLFAQGILWSDREIHGRLQLFWGFGEAHYRKSDAIRRHKRGHSLVGGGASSALGVFPNGLVSGPGWTGNACGAWCFFERPEGQGFLASLFGGFSRG